ncbi:MAG TPA: 30S ribosomal protein S15 [Patescibacteria group bacterium]|nr:30S ribosomal protein S15 [Patescibacteria group bacterium]
MLTTEEKKKAIKKVVSDEKNTGSANVQISLLTEKILKLNDHLKKNIHDFSSKRGLLKNVGQRRKLLKYLKNSDPKKYEEVLAKLGLRK